MRIAQVSPLYESVPPKLYGGTERVVSTLTEELVGMGHDVTLFASGDSLTSARLIPCCPRSLRLDEGSMDQYAHHIYMLEQVQQHLDEFDMVHYHTDYSHFPLSRRNEKPNLTTLHGRLDIPDLVALFNEFRDLPMVSISDNQRTPLPKQNWQATIYHGLPETMLTLEPREGQYLAFLGRVSPEKGLDRAIEVAKRVGIPLKIAAKVSADDRAYYTEVIKPMLNDPLIEFIGEIGEDQKQEFLGNAIALLFLINWPEPFGLVMIEAMACGTPVIGYDLGSVPEVVEEGVTGFIVRNQEEAVQAVKRIDSIDRLSCRNTFERRFSASRMANDYVTLYKKLLNHRQ